MTQVQDMTDQQLNVALAELTGFPIDMVVPNYCNDPAASLDIQAAACKIDKSAYIGNLSYVMLGKSVAYLEAVSLELAADFCTATDRQRAEAAYTTLSQGGSES